MAHVHGVGKDQETIANDQGGKQSNSPYRADLLPPLALLSVAQVLKQGPPSTATTTGSRYLSAIT